MNHSDLAKLQAKYPLSAATIRRNQAAGQLSSAQPQRPVQDEPLAKVARKEGHPTRLHVRVISFRRRLIDPDNCVPKWFIDCLRRGGWIEDDTAAHIEVTTSQQKVTSKDQERTELVIEPI
jgi:hypothetical protein